MQTPQYTPLYVEGKRDKARRYVGVDGQIVSRRHAEGLTAKQRQSRQNRQVSKQPSKRFIVKKRQTLAKFQTYRIKAYNVEEAINAYSQSKRAQKLNPAFIKITARGMVKPSNDSGHEDVEGRLNWRTVVAPLNPENFIDNLNKIQELAEQNIEQMFDASPVEFAVLLYVPNEDQPENQQ